MEDEPGAQPERAECVGEAQAIRVSEDVPDDGQATRPLDQREMLRRSLQGRCDLAEQRDPEHATRRSHRQAPRRLEVAVRDEVDPHTIEIVEASNHVARRDRRKEHRLGRLEQATELGLVACHEPARVSRCWQTVLVEKRRRMQAVGSAGGPAGAAQQSRSSATS